jgi:phosphatidylinositol phospholipase C delta
MLRPETRPGTKLTIIPELADLMVYTSGVKYQGFSKLIEYKTTEMFSVSEKVAKKLLRMTPTDFIKHNRTHLSRVYPQGTRISSSNYLPHHYWAMGCHLVALNWQTYGKSFRTRHPVLLISPRLDLGFAINHAMFTRNGRCGWLLKPDSQRTKNKNAFTTPEDRILHLNVSLYSPVKASRLKLHLSPLYRSYPGNHSRFHATFHSTKLVSTWRHRFTSRN